MLPLVLLDVIDLTEAIDLAVDKSSNNIDEAFNCAKRVISMRIDHAGFLVKVSENFIVSVALLEVLVSSLVAASDQIDSSILSCNGS